MNVNRIVDILDEVLEHLENADLDERAAAGLPLQRAERGWEQHPRRGGYLAAARRATAQLPSELRQVITAVLDQVEVGGPLTAATSALEAVIRDTHPRTRWRTPGAALRAVDHRRDHHVLILGGPLSGKSRLVRHLLTLWGESSRILLPDLLFQYAVDELPGCWRTIFSKASERTVRDALADRLSLHFTMDPGAHPDVRGFVDRVGDVIRHFHGGPAILVLDEAGALRHQLPKELASFRRRRRLRRLVRFRVGFEERTLRVRRRRRRDLSLVATFQNFDVLSRTPHPRFDIVVIGRLAARDAEIVARRLGRRFLSADNICALNPGEFYVLRARDRRGYTAPVRMRLPPGW